ncbi:SxtJ family membrane protein [uncultured Desulfovibrio sp.]|uniref:SxtJ family membrane protein n=1 Tax=uncultured Desulfovibrio sp. TaxID=167968 RepID=UPI0028043038|nr:SxtJ family membrane protein [uncultured Desulfovibrio sp.]
MPKESRPTRCVTPLQERDTCLALTFLLLLLWMLFRWMPLVWGAMGVLLLGMTVPAALRPLAWLWFGLARVLGAVTSRVVLTVVYVAVLLPVALIRRLLGKDDLKLARWKRGRGSCFLRREHVFCPEDFRHPY